MTDAEKVRILREAVQQVLDDEESGVRPDGTRGWGPDVTMVFVLKDVMDRTA